MMKSLVSKFLQRSVVHPSSNGARGLQMSAGDLARPVPRLTTKWTCKQTTQLLNSYTTSPCAVVCDTKDRPVGLIVRDRYFLQITTGDWHTMNTMPITKLMNEPLIIDAACTLTQLKEQLMRMPMRLKQRYVIVTKDGQLSGVIVLDDRLCPVND
ncbi:hypothetical protein DFQ01_11390 [Paenibacillus cellulosilyticus]|uniref:CBS domain protein n=1 Tax=Paenibacillus cellulosilyticus TaxID=375489 RepID=A0A2V2YRF1_9BACL|nr:hypothetical protein [Paenibacillus cellulosilyticus]PWV99716.1 hypothetical protein DFQ01_11390 [Paenibacillus cellulosilyticus]QKS44851.1 hypothetical protein HUB94_10845 [Paenibacillus cellulosilyticus]